MHYIYSHSEIRLASAVGALVRLIFWPVFVLRMALVAIKGLRPDATSMRANYAKTLRDELESVAATSLSTSKIFELRVAFDRYVALADAISTTDIDSGAGEILRIAGHEHDLLAKSCISRRMSRKLRDHYTESRNDLAGLMASFALPNDKRVENIVDRLTSLTADDLLQTAIFERERTYPVSPPARIAA